MNRNLAKFHLAGNFFCSIILVSLLALGARFLSWNIVTYSERELPKRVIATLSSLPEPVVVKAVLSVKHPVYPIVREVLSTFAQTSGGRLSVEWIDPHRDLAAAAENRTNGETLVFVSSDPLRSRELVPLDSLKIESNEQTEYVFAELVRACGEALVRLGRRGSKVLFLSGHGERDIESFDAMLGYSEFAGLLRSAGFEVSASDGTDGAIQNSALVVIAGPAQGPSDEIEASLLEFFKSGGKAIILIDRSAEDQPSGWETVLSALGVKTERFTAISERTPNSPQIIVDRFSPHVIANRLEGRGMFFSEPTVLSAQSNGDVVVAAPDKAWGEVFPERLPRQFDGDVDRKGKLPLVIAMPNAVVIGDSDFGGNAFLKGSRTCNGSLLVNAVSWLTGESDSFEAINSLEPHARQTGMTMRRSIRSAWYAVVILPLIMLIVGGIARIF